MQLGAQLYTVREKCSTLNGFAEALKRVADIGYKTVQVSGTCTFEPEWLSEQLKQNGLKCVLTHTPPARITNETDTVISEHQILECKYIGIGMAPHGAEREDWYNGFYDTFINAARKIKSAGGKLMYHNHNIEFARTGNKREIWLDRIINDFTPDELGITLDTYWVQAGGADPAWWLEHLKGRVPCIHLKDMVFYPGNGLNGARMAPVYEGNMNFDAILYAAEHAGTEYLLIEQDDCYDKDPFDCLKCSYDNLKAKGLN